MSHAPYEPIPQAPPQWAQQPVAQRAPSRLLPILGVVLGSLGLVAGVGAWFRAAPSHEGAAAVYSEQEVSEAKAAVCEAYGKGLRAIQVAGGKKPGDPSDPLPVVAVNGRVAEVAVGNYLINTIGANQAAPSELGKLVSQLGKAYQDIALTQLGDGSRADVAPIAEEADRSIAKIEEICQ
jgi:hypothetical protein